jgi:hypothetical protein
MSSPLRSWRGSTVMHTALRKKSDEKIIVDRIAYPRRLGHNTAHRWLVSTRLAAEWPTGVLLLAISLLQVSGCVLCHCRPPRPSYRWHAPPRLRSRLQPRPRILLFCRLAAQALPRRHLFFDVESEARSSICVKSQSGALRLRASPPSQRRCAARQARQPVAVHPALCQCSASAAVPCTC